MSDQSTSDPVNLFSQLANVVDTMNAPMTCDGCVVDLNITCSGAAASVESLVDATVSDWYLLTLDMSVMPPSADQMNGSVIEMMEYLGMVNLKVTVEPVDAYPEPTSLPLSRFWMPPYIPGGGIQPLIQGGAPGSARPEVVDPLTPGGTRVSSAPPTTVNTTTYSLAMTEEIGGNIGIFGETPTAGINGSLSITSTESHSISDVEVDDQGQTNMAAWEFKLVPNSESSLNTFAPKVVCLFQRPDSNIDPSQRVDDPGAWQTAPVALFGVTVQATVAAVALTKDSFLAREATWNPSWVLPLVVPVRVPPLPASS